VDIQHERVVSSPKSLKNDPLVEAKRIPPDRRTRSDGTRTRHDPGRSELDITAGTLEEPASESRGLTNKRSRGFHPSMRPSRLSDLRHSPTQPRKGRNPPRSAPTRR